MLAQAVKRLFPDAKIAIGPAIEDGFYYDFEAEPFSRETLDKLEAEMKKIIKEGHELKRYTLPREEAIKFMQEKNEPFKVEPVSYTHLIPTVGVYPIATANDKDQISAPLMSRFAVIDICLLYTSRCV